MHLELIFNIFLKCVLDMKKMKFQINFSDEYSLPLSHHPLFYDHFFLKEKWGYFGHILNFHNGVFLGSFCIPLVSISIYSLMPHKFNYYSFINSWEGITYFRRAFVILATLLLFEIKKYYANILKYLSGILKFYWSHRPIFEEIRSLK